MDDPPDPAGVGSKMASTRLLSKFDVSFKKFAMSIFLVLTIFLLILLWRIRPVPSVKFSINHALGTILDRIHGNAAGLQPNRTEVKRILLWTSFFGHKDFYFGLGREPFVRNKCSVSDCEMTTDQSLLHSSDAIVFHFRETIVEHLPRWRRPDQRWVFFYLESPDNTLKKNLRVFNGLFNWTMTYRLDSDVVATYGASAKISAPSRWRPKPTKAKSSGEKRRLAAWLVSNCKTSSKREKYVKELQRYMPIDVYGACAENQSHRTCPEKSCGAALYRSHKFYLAFENSVCRDYVTEKFFKALRNHVVPVVYGGADYERVAPPGSYVDVRDFESPRHLAEYLKLLDSNDTLYEEYFNWTEDWKVLNNWGGESSFCHLCAALHRPHADKTGTTKVYDDIATWWAGPNICGQIYRGNSSS